MKHPVAEECEKSVVFLANNTYFHSGLMCSPGEHISGFLPTNWEEEPIPSTGQG